MNRQDLEREVLAYLKSLPQERRLLLDRFLITDAALRVGGVGSVGTRCSILLLEADAEQDVLILQQKEAGPSALAAFLPKKRFTSQAERVVIGQRAMQAASDIFLGWNRIKLTGKPYYYRQLKDKKGSFEMQKLDVSGLGAYLEVCGLCLARAHARTGDSVWISGYLGSGTVFDEAIGDFAVAYADQVELFWRCKDLYSGQEKLHKASEGEYKRIAGEYGLSPNRIIVNIRSGQYQKTMQRMSAPNPTTGEKLYSDDGGQTWHE